MAQLQTYTIDSFPERLHSQLMEKIEKVNELPGKYQQTLISMLDSFVKRYKFEMLANS